MGINTTGKVGIFWGKNPPSACGERGWLHSVFSGSGACLVPQGSYDLSSKITHCKNPNVWLLPLSNGCANESWCFQQHVTLVLPLKWSRSCSYFLSSSGHCRTDYAFRCIQGQTTIHFPIHTYRQFRVYPPISCQSCVLFGCHTGNWGAGRNVPVPEGCPTKLVVRALPTRTWIR